MFYGKFIFSQSGMPNFLGGAWFPLLVPFLVSLFTLGADHLTFDGGGG